VAHLARGLLAAQRLHSQQLLLLLLLLLPPPRAA
jgi:hypothetical protein